MRHLPVATALTADTADARSPSYAGPLHMYSRKGAFGGAFDFAKQFKCECPKCIVPPAPEV